MPYRLYFSIAVCLLIWGCVTAQEQLWTIDEAEIHFVSDAPLERIEAVSKDLKGLLNTEDGTFAFSVEIRTFRGFNNPLQREHFNENYLESRKYPKALFYGKILEDLKLKEEGERLIRAKGIFDIHGVKRERIVEVKLEKQGDRISFSSIFQVPVEEHNIYIPKTVEQKISEIIDVQVKATMELEGEGG